MINRNFGLRQIGSYAASQNDEGENLSRSQKVNTAKNLKGQISN